jgi:hypothetical protein
MIGPTLVFNKFGVFFIGQSPSIQCFNIFGVDTQCFGTKTLRHQIPFFFFGVDAGKGRVNEQDDIQFANLGSSRQVLFVFDELNLRDGCIKSLNGLIKFFYINKTCYFL